MSTEVATRMIARAKKNPEQQARIINIASVGGLRALPKIGIYCISKAAVIHMTKVMALEWRMFGINVNAICPGYIRTEMNAEHFDLDVEQRLIQMLPRRRLGDASDIDDLLLLLASEKSRFINGAIISVDDGHSVL